VLVARDGGAQDWTRTSTRLPAPAAGAAGDPGLEKPLRAARSAAGAISCWLHEMVVRKTGLEPARDCQPQPLARPGTPGLKNRYALRAPLREQSHAGCTRWWCARLDSNQHEIASPSRWRGRGPRA